MPKHYQGAKRGRKKHPIYLSARVAYDKYGISYPDFRAIVSGLKPAAIMGKTKVPYYKPEDVLVKIRRRLREIVKSHQAKVDMAQNRYEEFLDMHPEVGLEESEGAK